MNSSISNDRLRRVDAAKAVAILTIVSGHCADPEGQDVILLHLSMFAGVSVFFFLSGYTFCRDVTRQFPAFDDRPWRIFLKGLSGRIVLPYFIWSVISILIYAAAGSRAAAVLGSSKRHFLIAGNILGMLYANSGTGYMEWNRPLWFLPCLTSVELIWFALLKCAAHIRRRAAAWCLTVIPILLSFGWLLWMSRQGLRLCLPWELETAFCVVSLFGLGVIARSFARTPPDGGEKRVPLPRPLHLTITVLLWLLLLVSLLPVETADFRADTFSNPALLLPQLITGAAAVFLAADLLQSNRACRYLGRRTLAVLVLHKFFVTGCKLLLRVSGVAGFLSGRPALTVAADLVMAAAATALSLGAAHVVSSVAPQAFGCGISHRGET